MAVDHEIFAPRIARFLQKFSGLKGFFRTTLGTELMPVLSMWSGVENRFLDSWNLFACARSQPPNAANVSIIEFRNPKTSGIVAVFQKILTYTVEGDVLLLAKGTTNADRAGGAVALGGAIDARSVQFPSMVLSSDNAGGGALTNMFQNALAANIAWDIVTDQIQEFPILPGDAIQIQTVAANKTLVASFEWRERALEDSEKS